MNPPLSTYRYGSERQPHEGLRIGVARFVPRGVRREDRSLRGYFDLWLPLLAPDPDLVESYRHQKITFEAFARHYRSEMKKPDCLQVIELLAGFSLFLPISLGCFCEDENKCHRSVLRQLVANSAEAKRPTISAVKSVRADLERYASPVCFANWEEEADTHR